MGERATARPEKSIVITGATGFLGGYAVREFLDAGYHIHAYGRNKARLNELAGPRVTTHPRTLEQLAYDHISSDCVIHAAALSSAWGTWPEFYNANVAGTQAVIDFCIQNSTPRLVYVSSPSIYTGPHDRSNIREDQVDPSNRLNNYIRSKLAAEQLLQAAHAAGSIPELVIIRPHGLIGLGDPSLMPRLLRANEKIGIPLFADGQHLTDLTCVENAALALRLAAETPHADGSVYNITNGEPQKFRDLTDQFFAALGEEPRYIRANRKLFYHLARAVELLHGYGRGSEPLLTRYTVCSVGYTETFDIGRARRELGYEPRISLREGLTRYATSVKESTR